MDNEFSARIVVFVVLVASGILVIWMARAAANGRLGRNHIAGIRIPSTMASDEAWLAAHRRAERPTIWAGVCAIVGGVVVLIPAPIVFVSAGVFAACMAVLGFVLYGARVGGRAAKAVTGN